MRAGRTVALGVLAALGVWAHPMGNFSVSHYARLQAGVKTTELEYVLDLAEIPTFQELQRIGATPEKRPSGEELNQYAERRGAEWLGGLELERGGQKLTWRLRSARVVLAEGAGGLPTMKIHVQAAALGGGAGVVRYRDTNFPGRAGWKEIVVEAQGAVLRGADAFAGDLSQGLTIYPERLFSSPPQMLEAAFQVTAPSPAPLPDTAPPAPPVLTDAPATPAPRPPDPSFEWGTVTRGDFLSQVLSGRQLGWQILILSLGVAFCLGAFHALSPGHGKTIVAAYLVGSRGTVKHALFLGGIVTLTHTMGVFLLGIVVLLGGPRLVPEKLYPWLGIACGLSIVGIGLTMFRKRLAALHHHHPHDHRHSHYHDDHHHDSHHVHGHHLDHHHRGHSHEMPDHVTWGSLLALGVSGGIVPCPSALVVLLAAISLNRAGMGVLLILAFSLGLALVLSSIGIAMVKARGLFDRLPVHGRLAQRLPVLSSAVVSVLGLGIAVQALLTVMGR